MAPLGDKINHACWAWSYLSLFRGLRFPTILFWKYVTCSLLKFIFSSYDKDSKHIYYYNNIQYTEYSQSKFSDKRPFHPSGHKFLVWNYYSFLQLGLHVQDCYRLIARPADHGFYWTGPSAQTYHYRKVLLAKRHRCHHLDHLKGKLTRFNDGQLHIRTVWHTVSGEIAPISSHRSLHEFSSFINDFTIFGAIYEDIWG